VKKSDVVIILILLFSVVSIYGKKPKTQVAIPDTVKLQLITPLNQNIQVNCVDIDRKFYFINELVLAKQDILDNKLCFLLNADLTISDVSIRNQNISLKQYRNVSVRDFASAMEPQTFENIRKKSKIYEFVINKTDNLPEQVNIRIKYHFLDKDSLFIIPSDKDWIDLKGTDFWYPRHPERDEEIALFVKSTDQNSFYLNGKIVEYSQKRYLKEYRTSFTDLAASPAVLMFRKSGLK